MPNDAWQGNDELDALRAAPQHHTLLLENEQVRMLDTHVAPGQVVPLHTHRWPAALYVQSWSDFVRRDAEGTVMVDSRLSIASPPVGTAVWTEPLGPHTLENVGATELRVLAVEMKDH